MSVRPTGSGRRAARTATLPALLAATSAMSMAAPRLAKRLSRRLPAPVADAAASALFAGVGWSLLAGLERAMPLRPGWAAERHELRTDVRYLAVATPVSGVATSVAANVLATRLRRSDRRDGRARWPVTAPLPVKVAGALVLTEFVQYWYHRASHHWGPLWWSHRTHHEVGDLYWLNSLRLHPVDIVPLGTLQLLPLLLFDIDRETLVAFQVFKGIHGQIQHSNIDADSPWLDRIFSTPAQHRRHHAADLPGQRSNYGSVLSFFDQAFGTLDLVPRRRARGSAPLEPVG